ncbi:adhesion G protein-coupled receptor L3-like [Zootermopsis nevadensis]|uniref:adhesion G protein-coupled receptor L3-like n=1 Tax=Zootermopsis nevadensis TaxID=136037 RepID=UPI000B8E8050|nr:adhesion G protein-coupled receptor L3-like [Zootermopsis nevadensis]
MDVHDYVGKDAALEVLSFTCSGASVLCLLVTLAVFQGCRSIQGERTDIGKNVCACLLGGHVTTLFFLDKTYINFSEVSCSIVAGSLHYLFLAAFCWMTVEGHHLYRMVVTVFDNGRDFRRWYQVVGYGAPAFVVILTTVVAVLRGDRAYGNEELCWLSSPVYIWTFIGPVLLLSVINTAVLVLALREAVSAGLSQGKSKTETVWIWIRGWFSLSALLGITWLFGLAYMEFNHSFVYVFVVLNGCQGLFIFLFRCVLSHQVRVSVTTRVKRDGFLELLRGLAMRCSPRPSDSTRTTATEHTDWVHDDRSNRPLWFVLTQGDKAAFNWESSIRGSPDHTAVDKSNCDQTGSPCAESGKMNRESYEGSGNLGQRDICPAVSGCQNWSQRSVSASRCSTIDEEPDPDC